MCADLTRLFNLLENPNLPVTRTDIIRVACGNCERHEVCCSVTSEEFDNWQPMEVDEPHWLGFAGSRASI